MSLLVFEHHPKETSAQFGAILQSYGHHLRVVRLYDDEKLPPALDGVDGIVSMGGPMNVDDAAQHTWIELELGFLRKAHEENVPIVGICLGAQLIAAALGGEVAAMEAPEIGWHNVKLAFPGTVDPVFAGIGWDTTQFHVHSQEVSKLPPGATPLAGSQDCTNQAFRVGMTTYAFQYHFEWSLPELKQVASLDFVTKAGGDADHIIAECGQYYDDYRRLGDRLSNTIATVLIPIGKR